MRDLIVFMIVAISLPKAFRTPFVGLLTFSWLGYMRAQDLCWGFARTLRFSYLVAFTMILGWVLHESTKRRFALWDIRTKIMAVMMVVTALGLIGARDQSAVVINRYIEFVKILVIAIFTAGQVTSRRRLRLLLWTIALSLGFFGFKNGVLGVLSGGAPIVRGPGGMLLDNNDFALALVMNVPLLWYLGQSEKALWIRRGTMALVVLTLITIVLTKSRGAFLAVSSVLFMIWLRSRRKGLGAAIAIVGVIVFFTIVPSHVIERLQTIQSYEKDASAMGRIMAWKVAFGMIADYPLLGVGMRNFQRHFADYLSFHVSWTPVAHNSYLQIWAEGGTISLVLYVTMLVSSFAVLGKLRKIGSLAPGAGWVREYAVMLEVSLVGFVVGGMFLNRGHFDLVYHLIAIVSAFHVVALRWVRQPAGHREGDEEDENYRAPLEAVPRGSFARAAGPPVFVSPGDRRPVWRR